jgi:hypothetical protein
MGGYDVQQVCKKWGHQVTDRFNSSPGKKNLYCLKCGSETVTKCDKCGEEIKGYYHSDVVWDLSGNKESVPSCCSACGEPFPWKWWFDIKNIVVVCISPAKYLIDAAVKVFTKK